MCTVAITISESGDAHLLAVRDEDPAREWDELGAWWPEEFPGVVGIRDRRAGGAWLAVNSAERTLAVLLNRADVDNVAEPAQSRGSLALHAATGTVPTEPPHMHGFNLLIASPSASRVISWDGHALRETPITPGVHMIAHDDLDDPETARIAAWLPHFRAAASEEPEGEWWTPWLEVLADSAALPPEDDRAIIRDNRAHGYPTLSLLYCVAAVTAQGTTFNGVRLREPGHLAPGEEHPF